MSNKEAVLEVRKIFREKAAEVDDGDEREVVVNERKVCYKMSKLIFFLCHFTYFYFYVLSFDEHHSFFQFRPLISSDLWRKELRKILSIKRLI